MSRNPYSGLLAACAQPAAPLFIRCYTDPMPWIRPLGAIGTVGTAGRRPSGRRSGLGPHIIAWPNSRHLTGTRQVLAAQAMLGSKCAIRPG